jgi:acetyltransferase-like isoleucine patch superfamily enzyme
MTESWKPPEIDTTQSVWYSPWHWYVIKPANLKLGHRTDIGAFTLLNCAQGIEIQDDVQIGSHCSLNSVNTIDGKQGKITLMEGCKIGSHTVIMPGVTVGRGSKIGANSFVNCSIPAREVWFGNPASYRFPIG